MISDWDIEKETDKINSNLDGSRLNYAKPIDIFELLDYLDIRLSIDFLTPDSSILGAAFFVNTETYTWPSNPYVPGMQPKPVMFKERTISLDQNLFESNNIIDIGKTTFTASHETGHIILHSKQNKEQFLLCREEDLKLRSISDEYAKQRELEANHFASSLLMPKSMILNETKRLMPEYKNNKIISFGPTSYKRLVVPLAKALNINITPVKIRLQELGLLTDKYKNNN